MEAYDSYVQYCRGIGVRPADEETWARANDQLRPDLSRVQGVSIMSHGKAILKDGKGRI